jgi:Rieske Fe-S protein
MSQLDQDPAVDQSAARGMDRRTVIRTVGAIGVGVVGAAALAACGGGDGTTATGKPAGSASPSVGTANDVIKVADIPVGGGKIFADMHAVVTQPKAGQFKAFSSICTHKGCPVSNVDKGTINCFCHGSKFDAATGKVTHGPAVKALPRKTVTVNGDSITIS